MWFIQFKKFLTILLGPWLLSVLIQFVGRLFLLLSYTDNLADHKADIVKLLIIGLRFDIRISCILFGSLFILTLLMLFFNKIAYFWQKLLSYLVIASLLIVTLFTIINIFYYITYDHHIDIFIFGLIDDDTTAVLKTIWSDYPIMWGIVGFIVLTYLFYKLTQYWVNRSIKRTYRKTPIWFAIPYCLIILSIIFIGCRGGIGTFPLRESDAQISEYAVFNEFVPNGLIAMSWAYSNYKTSNQFTNISITESQQAIKKFFGIDKPNSINIFMSKTEINPIVEESPPHVVFAVMESMGSHLFQFDNSDRDLLGSLRTSWQDDWVFSRFISEGDGTIDSLSRFLVRSPMDKISQSSAQNVTFLSNMFKPFKDKGYKIIYITAGNGAWRNLNQFLMNLGVDEFIEQNTLLHEFPEAELGTWGIPDEYMFKYAQKRLDLAEQQGEHVMIMMLSITNHPPYHLPAGNQYLNYTFTPEEQKRFKNIDNETELRNMFNTFHYSNDQLGQFINWIKNQPLAQHTILAATGDHNLRGIGYTAPEELALSHAVPFYLYVPKKYQNNTTYQSSRIGSHKDIMPTLYQLSLSDAPYYQTGCNLLAPHLDPLWCNIGYNPNVVINEQGAYSLINNNFLPWKEKTGLALTKNDDSLSEEQLEIVNQWQSWTKLLHWQLMKQIEQKNN